FGARGEVRLPRCQRIGSCRSSTSFFEKEAQGRRSQPEAGATQEMPAAEVLRPLVEGGHGRHPFVIVSARFNRTGATSYQPANSPGAPPDGTEKVRFNFLKPLSRVSSASELAALDARCRSRSCRRTRTSGSRGSRARHRRKA